MRRRLEEKGAPSERVRVIPNWVDTERLAPRDRVNWWAEKRKVHDKFVVMHSGNIGLSQGLETLVEAAARLRHVPDVQIVFIGDGVKKPALEARVRALGLANVRFLPFVAFPPAGLPRHAPPALSG